MSGDVPHSLARRWIGLHVLAFVLENLLSLCVWSAVKTVGDVAAFNRTSTAHGIAFGLPALLVAGAHAAALAGSSFPVRLGRWFLWTAGGIAAGQAAHLVAVDPAFKLLAGSFVKSQVITFRTALYAIIGILYLTEGLLLAGAQAVALRPRGLVWAASAGGGWFLGKAVWYGLDQAAQGVLGYSPHDATLTGSVVNLAGAALAGLVFSLVQLPALRRLLSPR